MMNYDKWNQMDLGDEEDEVGVDVGAEVNRLKGNADTLFHANESNSSSMPVSYKECIGLYERVLQLISAYNSYLELSIRCHLNLACCFIRESEWELAMKHGQIAYRLCAEEHWNEKLQARYFELHSLCKLFHLLDHAGRLSNHSQLLEAEEHVADMKKILHFNAALVSLENLANYEKVFHQVSHCIARVDKDIEGLAESHFEKAQQLQRLHQDMEAAMELSECAALTLQLRTPAHLCNAAKIHILIALIYVQHRDYSTAVKYYSLAQSILNRDSASDDPVLTATIVTGMSICALRLKQASSSTASDMFKSVCKVADCVFDGANARADEKNVAFLVHLLTQHAHIIDTAALHTHHALHTTTVQYAYVQHLLRCHNVLADVHAALNEWDMCNDVTDRTIDTCNALIAQFASTTTTPSATTTDTSPVHSTPNPSIAAGTTCASHVVTLLQRRRAECFVAKAMLYKDHSLSTARIGQASTASDTANAPSDTPSTTTAASTSYTWPSIMPLLTKSSVPSEYNQYATFHRLSFDTVSEAVAVFLQVAASEYEKIDPVQSMRTFHTLAEYTMQIAQIQPFDFSDASSKVSPTRYSNTSAPPGGKPSPAFTTTSYAGEIITTTTTTPAAPQTTTSPRSDSAVDKKDLAEKAADAWAKVSLQATRKVDSIQATLFALTAPTTTTTAVIDPDAQSATPYAVLRVHYFEKYFYLQQSMLALYYAGVCAFHFDVTLSQRNLESAEEVRKSIDALLAGELRSEFDLGEPSSASADAGVNEGATGSEITPNSPGAAITTGVDQESTPTVTTSIATTSAESRSLHGYYATCGDLSYHLAQAYLRLALYTEGLQAATSALAYYEHSERLLYLLNTINQYNTNPTNASTANLKNTKSYHSLLKMGVVGLVIPLAETTPTGRLRQRLCLTVCALCHSARGELKLVEQAVRRVGDLCLGPVEDATVEVAAVRRQLSQQQRNIQQEMNTSRPSPSQGSVNSRKSGRSGSPQSVPAAIAIDGSKVSNSVLDYDSETEQSSGAKVATSASPKKEANNGISNLRVEKVPSIRKTVDYNLLIAYSIVSIVVIAIVVGLYWK